MEKLKTGNGRLYNDAVVEQISSHLEEEQEKINQQIREICSKNPYLL